MIIRLMLLLNLIGCSTTNYDNDIYKLSKDIIRLEYYIAHDKCFNNYSMCMVDDKADCWSQHEKCVIAVYKRYKPLLD